MGNLKLSISKNSLKGLFDKYIHIQKLVEYWFPLTLISIYSKNFYKHFEKRNKQSEHLNFISRTSGQNDNYFREMNTFSRLCEWSNWKWFLIVINLVHPSPLPLHRKSANV